jgi:hypothetical protein
MHHGCIAKSREGKEKQKGLEEAMAAGVPDAAGRSLGAELLTYTVVRYLYSVGRAG